VAASVLHSKPVLTGHHAFMVPFHFILGVLVVVIMFTNHSHHNPTLTNMSILQFRKTTKMMVKYIQACSDGGVGCKST